MLCRSGLAPPPDSSSSRVIPRALRKVLSRRQAVSLRARSSVRVVLLSSSVMAETLTFFAWCGTSSSLGAKGLLLERELPLPRRDLHEALCQGGALGHCCGFVVSVLQFKADSNSKRRVDAAGHGGLQ